MFTDIHKRETEQRQHKEYIIHVQTKAEKEHKTPVKVWKEEEWEANKRKRQANDL